MISCPHLPKRKLRREAIKPHEATQQVHWRAKPRPPFSAHTFSHTLRPKLSCIHSRKGNLDSAFT